METGLTIVSTIKNLRRERDSWRARGKTIALVPTMGALHEGHLSLVHLAKQQAERVIVTIFVNPAQFGAGEDLDTYPRPLKRDINLLKEVGADLVFTPLTQEIYPDGFATKVSVTSQLTQCLCGASRPGHFDGVATIVTKLLLQSLPDIAIFGEKDYQQLLVIKRLSADLNIPTAIIGAPIARATDGLALSSRNRYLSKPQRVIAPKLYQTLTRLAQNIRSAHPIEEVLAAGRKDLEIEGFVIDYLDLRQISDLSLQATILPDQPARLFVAACLGSTRLIDNIAV